MKNGVIDLQNRFAAGFLMICLMLPSMSDAADVGYSAMVMDVRGKAAVRHAGASKSIDLGYLLYPGDSVETTKDAALTIAYLESGQEEQWTGGAKFVIEKDGSKPAPAKLTKKGKINVPQITSPQKGSFSMKRMSPPQAGGFAMKSVRPPQRGSYTMLEVEKPRDRILSIETPKAEVVGLSNTKILDEKPAFRWRSVSSAQHYEIEFFDFSDDEPAWQNATNNTELIFPSEMAPLRPGSEYRWTITAFKDGRPVAQKESCFGLPQVIELVEIRKVVNDYREQIKTDAANPAVRLRFALFLEGHQLYDEALLQYETIRKLHGESESLMQRQKKIIELRNMPCPTYE